MYKTASKNLQRRRAGNGWKYAKPRDSRIPNTGSSPVSDYQPLSQSAPTPVLRVKTGSNPPSPIYTQCPTCQVRVKTKNLKKHRRKVHAEKLADPPKALFNREALQALRKVHAERSTDTQKVESGVRNTADSSTSPSMAMPTEDIHIADHEFLCAKINVFYARSGKNRAIEASEEFTRCGADAKLAPVTKSTSQDHAETIYFFPQAQGDEQTATRIALALRQIGVFKVASFELAQAPPVGYSVWIINSAASEKEKQ